MCSQEDNKIAELAEKYRDRASERRKGVNPDYQADDPVATVQAYRAVAPDLKSGINTYLAYTFYIKFILSTSCKIV